MLKLIKYNDGVGAVDIWYFVNSEDTLASPVFETKDQAISWAHSRTELDSTKWEWL